MMIAAVAMSALTLGLSVLPATLGPGAAETRLGATTGAGAPMTTGIAGSGTPIIVYGVREETTAFRPVRQDVPTGKEAG
jgi:hypothetical protein